MVRRYSAQAPRTTDINHVEPHVKTFFAAGRLENLRRRNPTWLKLVSTPVTNRPTSWRNCDSTATWPPAVDLADNPTM